jgi:hypothetical protein
MMDGITEAELSELREAADAARAALDNGAIRRAFDDCEAALVYGLKNTQLTEHDSITALTSQLQVIDAVKNQISGYIDQYQAAKDVAEQGDN